MYLSLALLRRSIRQSKGRLALISGAVAFGVCLLLVFASFFNAFGRDSSDRWQIAVNNTITDYVNNEITPTPNPHSVLINSFHSPFFTIKGEMINAIYVDTAYTKDAPDLYGLDWPKHGEYLVSAGLDAQITANPDARIGDRFGSRQTGILPYQLTKGADDLLVFIGADLSKPGHGFPIADFDQASALGTEGHVLQAVMTLGLIILMSPVLLLISISAMLGSVQREQRYGALRLVGATKKQMWQILTLESLCGAAIGYVAGLGAFFALSPFFDDIRIVGHRYWGEYFTVPAWQHLLVFVVTIALVFGANAWGLRSINASPLGVVRRQKIQKKPRSWRIIPILCSVTIFVFLAVTIEPNKATETDLYILMLAIILMMIGLLTAAPWGVHIVSTAIARIAHQAPLIIGMKYVSAHSSRIAKSISGIVLALFAGTFFITAISESAGYLQTATIQSPIKPTTAFITYSGSSESDSEADAGEAANAASHPEELANHPEVLAKRISNLPYVVQAQSAPLLAGAYTLLSCSHMEVYFDRECSLPMGAFNIWDPSEYALIQGNNISEIEDTLVSQLGADLSSSDTSNSYSLVISVQEPANLELLRTDLITMNIYSLDDWFNAAFGDQNFYRSDAEIIRFLTAVVYCAMGLTLAISVISMLISTYANMMERRRSLLTLRLSGMRVRDLVYMMLIESAAPLVAVALFTTGIGYATGRILMSIVSASLDARFSPALLIALMLALALSTLVMLSLAPALRKISAPANNRSE